MRITIVNMLPIPSVNASVTRFLGHGKELSKLHILSSASFDDRWYKLTRFVVFVAPYELRKEAA